MTARQFMRSTAVFVEIGQSSFKALDGDDGLELPLERTEGGRLSRACTEGLAARLKSFVERRRRLVRPRAFCAIGARGVSLRRLLLPPAPKENFDEFVSLQIEKEFPLPPDELAWGCRKVSPDNLPRNRGTDGEELIVVAVRKDVIDDYRAILAGCGLSTVFTLGALARSSVCPQPLGSYAVLDIGRDHSELIAFDQAAPCGIRILPWGGENITRSIEMTLGASRDEAERLKIQLSQEAAAGVEHPREIENVIRSEIGLLANRINGHWRGQSLYLTGKTARLKNLSAWLCEFLGTGVRCERVRDLPGEIGSAAILGLKQAWEKNGASPLLLIEAQHATAGERIARPLRWKWALAASVLVLTALALRYAEPALLKSRLSKRLTDLKTYREALPKIDRELGFLQYLKTNQPPHLEALAILANAAPPGTRVDSVAMNRGGDLSLRLTMQNPQQAMEFRSKLIDSGFFSAVVLDEQSPSPDRQKVSVRMTARWKPANAREALRVNVPPTNGVQRSISEGKDGVPGAPRRIEAPLPSSPPARPSPTG